MKRTGTDLLASRRWIVKRSRGLMGGALILAAVLISACGASPDTQTGSVAQTSAVPSSATARPTEVIPTTVVVDEASTARVEMTATAELVSDTPTVAAESTTGVGMSEGGTAVVDADVAPVTAVMEELGLEGEQFAAVGDPGAPITVIEFSDYG